jgi:hypothetical protein
MSVRSFWTYYKKDSHINYLQNEKSAVDATNHKILMSKYNKVRTLTDDTTIKNNITNVKSYRKLYRDPESVENIQKFISEINQLGCRTPGYSNFNSSINAINIDKKSNIRIEKLEKKSWKQSCRNYHK